MEHDGSARELHRDVFLRIERICQFSLIVVALCVETVSHISREEEVSVEIGCGESRQTHTIAVNEVMRDNGINRSDIKL